MELKLSAAEFGRLICNLSDGPTSAVVTAADFGHACDDLARALDALESRGIGECYWPEGAGEYRWVFRRVDGRARVAALWSAGVLTGWEHVFWAECDCAELLAATRAELARASAPAARND